MRDYEKLMAYWPRRLDRESERRMNLVRTTKIPKYLMGDGPETCDEAPISQAKSQAIDPTRSKPPVSDHSPNQLADSFAKA